MPYVETRTVEKMWLLPVLLSKMKNIESFESEFCNDYEKIKEQKFWM